MNRHERRAAEAQNRDAPNITGGGTEADQYVDDVVEKMKVCLANIEDAKSTMIGETTKAAHLLVEARKKHPDRVREICRRVGIQFEGTRYYELLSLGAGRKTMAQIKDANAKRKRAERDRKRALPQPAPRLSPAAPIVTLEPVRDVTDRVPERDFTASPKMLSAEQAWIQIHPILEKVETRALGDISRRVFNYATRRQNKAQAS